MWVRSLRLGRCAVGKSRRAETRSGIGSLAAALLLSAAGALAFAVPALAQSVTGNILQVGPARDDRYSLEVSFPSPAGSRVILDESTIPSLGNIDPGLIPGRTLTIYRDGRVVSGIPLGLGAARRPAAGALESRRARDSRTPTLTGLRPSYLGFNPGFTSYGSGTVVPSWGDYDNDGDVDLPMYRNDGGTFTEIDGFRALLQFGNYHGSSWGDYDKDGDLDLLMVAYYVPGSTNPTRTLLLRNDGGVFTDVAPELGIDIESRGETAIWADFNLDSWPDLFVPYYSHVVPYDTYFFMYRNDGQGHLVDVSDSAGVWLSERFVEGVDVTDWEGDGDLDLYFTSRLYLNDGAGHFTDASQQVGLPDRFDEGGAFVDHDNDGDFDLYVRNADTARLFRNDDGVLADVTLAAGIPAALNGLLWGDAWADADNDGDQDFLYHMKDDRVRLMLNQGDGTFAEDPDFALMNIAGAMAAWADYDRDGDLDFVENSPPDSIYQSQLDLMPGFEGTYLRVRVLDAQGFETEQGAVVRLRPANGAVGLVQTRTVGGGSTYLSHPEYTAHFGLGIPGTVTVDPELPDYPPGTEVQLTAVPEPGYQFTHWNGDASGTANPVTIVMDGLRNVTASFALVTHTVATSAGAGGVIVRSVDQPTYPHGSWVRLTAVPDPGFRFVGWGGDTSGSVPSILLRIDRDFSVSATFADNGWVGTAGGGDGTSWSDPANWQGGLVPGPGDVVLLDNAIVTEDYTVTLPGGATGAVVQRLTLAPAAGRQITLLVPSSSTAPTGLRVGDAMPGNDDLVLGPGAVVRDAASGSTGFGITTASPLHDRVRIEAGARYVHATLRSAAGVAPALSGAPGTETGEFVYDVPGLGDFAIPASGVTYGHLTLSRSAGYAAYTAAGSDTLTVEGDLRINPGVTLASYMTGALRLAGSLINDGTPLVLPPEQAVHFVGTEVQRLSGTVGVAIGGSSTVAAGATLAVGPATFENDGTMTIVGSLQIDPGGYPTGVGVYSYDASTGTLVFANQSPVVVSSTTRCWPASGGPTHVTVGGPGEIRMSVPRAVPGVFRTAALVVRADRLTLGGLVRIDPGGSLGRPPVYGNDATLMYATGVPVSYEWESGAAVGPGVPRHVIVDVGSGTVTLPAADRTVPGDLTIASGTLALDPSLGELVVEGNLAIDGVLASSGRAITLAGGALQTISGSGTVAVDRLRLAKSAESVRLLADLSIPAPAGGRALDFEGTTDRLDLNGRTLALGGTVGGANASGALAGGPGSGLVLGGAGAADTLGFEPGTARLKHFTLERGAAGSVTLGATLVVDSLLDLRSGVVVTGADSLFLGPEGTVLRGEGFVDGPLRKTLQSGAPNVTFEVGSNGAYAPVDLAFEGVTAGGTLTARTLPGDHPELPASAFIADRTVNRHWVLEAAGMGFDRCDATFHFASGDLDAGADPLAFAVRRYQPAAWIMTATGARTETSAAALDLTAFGDFAIGEIVVHTLAAGAAGHGTLVRDPDQTVFDHGTTLTLTASPLEGHAFVGWSGDTSTTGNPLVLALTRDWNLVGQFTYGLEATASGRGTVAREPDLTGYPPGTPVTVTATADTEHVFVGWEGDTTASENPLVLTMDRDLSLVARFADVVAPAVEVLAPNGGEAFAPGQAIELRWNASDATGIASVDLDLSRSGTAGPFEAIATETPNDGVHEWIVSEPTTGAALLRVTARDSAGNTGVDPGNGVFVISLQQLAVENEDDGSEITEFALTVTSNPIRSGSRIVYSLPHAAPIQLSVLDVQGREVARLADGFQPAGRHSAAWSADRGGPGPAPGIYFVRFRNPVRDLVRRVVVTATP